MGLPVTLLGTDRGLGYYCAQPVRPTEPPPKLTGSPMNRQAVFSEDGSVSGAWATVFVRDVYEGLEPHVKRGQIRQIAVVQEIEKSTHSPQNNVTLDGHGKRNIAVFGFQFPLVSCGATYVPKKVWGFADVHEDGRFRWDSVAAAQRPPRGTTQGRVISTSSSDE